MARAEVRDGTRPIGIFVPAEDRTAMRRAAALANGFPPTRPVTVFCARDDLFPPVRPGVSICRIPSLVEPRGDEPRTMDHLPVPDTMHGAPLGWGGIREAMATLSAWFHTAHPALMIVDGSAEVGQLARLCSVPHVQILDHGDRSDPGHRAAYDGAAALLAPFHDALCQPDWSAELRARTCFAPGLDLDTALPSRRAARRKLGWSGERPIILSILDDPSRRSAGDALEIAARGLPEFDWHVIGGRNVPPPAGHPANLTPHGWVEAEATMIAAADLIVAACELRRMAQVLTAGKPWIVVPDWQPFEAERARAEALGHVGAAYPVAALPASAAAWRRTIAAARGSHDAECQAVLMHGHGPADAALWLEDLCARLWPPELGRAAEAERVSVD